MNWTLQPFYFSHRSISIEAQNVNDNPKVIRLWQNLQAAIKTQESTDICSVNVFSAQKGALLNFLAVYDNILASLLMSFIETLRSCIRNLEPISVPEDSPNNDLLVVFIGSFPSSEMTPVEVIVRAIACSKYLRPVATKVVGD